MCTALEDDDRFLWSFLTPKWPKHGQSFLIRSSSSGEVDQKHQVFVVGNLLNGIVQLTVEVVPHFG